VNIRAANSDDHEALLTIWLASARRTHHFLDEGEILALLPAASDYLKCPGHTLWVLCDERIPIGFMGLEVASIESLFIAPDRMRRGGGRALLAHARTLSGARLTVDVNEQNVDALAFYRASGFTITGRSPTDGQGRPNPLVHMRESMAIPTVVCSRHVVR
jgi:putative acetyltransferase